VTDVDDPSSEPNRKLDETIEESFPASDAPGNTVETGIRTGGDITGLEPAAVSDNRQLHRFELTVGGHTAFLSYERDADTLTLVHTEVPDDLRGQHVGDALVEAALRAGRAEGRRIVAICPFVRAYMRRRSPSR
jgi:predicted GNAT family acetyltransferase